MWYKKYIILSINLAVLDMIFVVVPLIKFQILIFKNFGQALITGKIR